METNKILTSNVLDIIFDGKNKQYGAYDLRNTYNSRLSKALFVTSSLAMVIFVGTVFASYSHSEANAQLVVRDVEFSTIKPQELMPVLPSPPPPVSPDVSQAKFTNPIVINKDVIDETIVDVTDDMMISSKRIESELKGTIGAPVEEAHTQVFEIPRLQNEDSTYITVQKEAEFPGGAGEWKRFLERHLDANLPVNNGAPGGAYQVRVQFVVSKDGNLGNVHAETKFGFGMEEEAVKIIQRGPKWIPALQNGRNVNAYRVQVITFLVQEN